MLIKFHVVYFIYLLIFIGTFYIREQDGLVVFITVAASTTKGLVTTSLAMNHPPTPPPLNWILFLKGAYVYNCCLPISKLDHQK